MAACRSNNGKFTAADGRGGYDRRMTRRLLISAVLMLVLPGAFWFESIFAPKPDPWPRWEAYEAEATGVIDHDAWNDLLRTYVVPGPNSVNRFAYSRLAATDVRRLDAYVEGLANVPISQYRRTEQLAYWINLYNALTVHVVVSHLPVASIRDINLSTGLFSGDGPWDGKLVEVEGEALSLNDIEHRILRPVWRDPRIHYAVNCASIGCPNLRREAYRGATVHRVLESAARDYVNHPRGVRIEGGKLLVSSIYVWFRDDFGPDDAAVIAHLRRYAGPTLAEKLAAVGEIAKHHYDWSLNDTDAGPDR